MWTRFNRWYLASRWHRVLLDSAFIGLMFGVLAAIDNHSFGFAFAAGVIAAMFSLVFRGLWGLVELWRSKQTRA